MDKINTPDELWTLPDAAADIATFGAAVALPDWTVLRDSSGEFWVLTTSTSQTATRLLVPIARSVLRGTPRSALKLDQGTDKLIPRGPFIVASLPLIEGNPNVSLANVWGYPLGSVFLDRYGDVWQLFNADDGARYLTAIGEVETRVWQSDTTPYAATYAPFRPIHVPGHQVLPAEQPAPFDERDEISNAEQFWAVRGPAVLRDENGRIWLIGDTKHAPRAWRTGSSLVYRPGLGEHRINEALPMRVIARASAFKGAPPVWFYADGSQEYGPYTSEPTTDTPEPAPMRRWLIQYNDGRPARTVTAARMHAPSNSPHDTYRFSGAATNDTRHVVDRQYVHSVIELDEDEQDGPEPVDREVIERIERVEALWELPPGLRLHDRYGSEWQTARIGETPAVHAYNIDGAPINTYEPGNHAADIAFITGRLPMTIEPITQVAQLWDLPTGVQFTDDDGHMWETTRIGKFGDLRKAVVRFPGLFPTWVLLEEEAEGARLSGPLQFVGESLAP